MNIRKVAAIISDQRDMIQSGLSSLALRIAGLASMFGLGVVLARVLGPAEYGVYGLVTSVAALAMAISLVGTPQLAVRELSVRSARGDWAGARALIRNFGLAASSTALLLGLAAVIGGLFLAPPSRHLPIILGALLGFLMTITLLAAAELRGLGAMLKGQVMDLFARPAASFVIVLMLALAGKKLHATDALLVQVLVAAVAAAISLAWIRRILPAEAWSVPASAQIGWVSAAIPLWMVDVLRQLDGTYGVILMGWFASAADLGVYRVALSCIVVVGLPISIFHLINAPIVSKLHSFQETEELQRVLSATSAWLVATVAPITIAAWFIGKPAVTLVFGAAYADAWLPLFIMCVGQLIYGLFGMGPVMLAMCDGERHLIRIYLVSVGLGIAAAIPLVNMLGSVGAAAAMAFSTGLIGFLSWHYGRKGLGVDSTFLPLLRRKE